MRGHQNPNYNRQMAIYGVPDFPLLSKILVKQKAVISLAPDAEIESRLRACFRQFKLSPQQRSGKQGCQLAICEICNLENSRRLIKKGAHFAYDYRLRGVHYTWVDQTYSTKADDLESLQLQRLNNTIITALKEIRQALGPKLMAIAALEFSLDETPPQNEMQWTASAKKLAHRWSPHWHIIVICENPILAKPYLTAALGVSTSQVDKRLVPKPSYTIGRHISYATKFEPERRAIVLDSNGNQDRKPRPLGSKRTKQLFTFFGDMTVSKRVRVLGNWKPTELQIPSTVT